ncbi:MAG: hypothetical protein WHV66_11855 [Anaerolineales bacterium]
MPDILLSCPNCGAQLSIPDTVQRFACEQCGTPLRLERSGGIAYLAEDTETAQQMASRVREAELAHLRRELEREIQFQMLDVPAYQLLRYDFVKIGAIKGWEATFARGQERLEKVFRNLTLEQLQKLIDLYSANPQSPTAAWLKRVQALREKIRELERE